jgi:glutamine amidotransferase
MSESEVVVIDYGFGNLLSVRRGLEHCGAIVTITSDPAKIISAQRLVLPGVGAFGNAMQSLVALGLASAICEAAERGTHLLGICLGMQLLLDESEEFGITKGLGIIHGRVTPIKNRSIDGQKIRIPHIGWTGLLPFGHMGWKGTLLADNIPGNELYFIHSFMATPDDQSHRLADCEYGGHRIPAVIKRNNVTGCQFHPEKSGELGLRILRRFVGIPA